MNLQAALQGILFITELVTYFLLSGYAQNKWQAYALTSISWCLVNGMDGYGSTTWQSITDFFQAYRASVQSGFPQADRKIRCLWDFVC